MIHSLMIRMRTLVILIVQFKKVRLYLLQTYYLQKLEKTTNERKVGNIYIIF